MGKSVNVGSLVVDLELNSQNLTTQEKRAIAELTNLQKKLSSMNSGQMSEMLSKLDIQILNTTNKIAKMQAKLAEMTSDSNSGKFKSAQIFAVQEKILSLQESLSKTAQKSALVGETMEKSLLKINDATKLVASPTIFQKIIGGFQTMGQKINETTTNSANSLKRFALSLIGIRALFSILSGAARSYIAENDALNNKLELAKMTLGASLAPVIEFVVNLFAKLVNVIATALGYLYTFINALFGTKLGLAKVAKSTKGVGSAAKGAAKEMSNLASFDKLNVLSNDQGSSDGGGGVAPGLEIPNGGQILSDKTLQNIAKFGEMVTKYATPIKIFGGLIALLGILAKTAISPFAGLLAVIGLIVVMVTNWDNLGKIMKIILISVTALIAGFATLVIVNQLLNATVALNPIAFIIASIVAGVIALTGLLIIFKDDLINIFKIVFDSLSNLFKAIFDVFKITFDGVINFWKMVIAFLQQGVVFAIDIFKNLINGVGDFFKGVAGFISGLITGIVGGIRGAFDSVLASVRWIWGQINALLGQGGQLFNGIIGGVVNAIRFMVNAILRGLNVAIGLPFRYLNSVLNTIRNISLLGVAPFRGLWGSNPIPIPQIPLLAKGGVLTKATMVVAGEYSGAGSNPEIVTPENLMADTFRRVLKENRGGPEKLVVVTEIGGVEVGRKVIDLINSTQEVAGRTLLKV